MSGRISVIVPTIAGREDHLDRCLSAYRATTPAELLELIVICDRPTCGIAWQDGADQADGDYVHFSADDLEPQERWWQAATAVCDNGALPAPKLFYPDGRLQACGGSWEADERDGDPTSFTRVPFLSRAQLAQVGPMIPTHYYTDNWISWRGAQAGIPTVVSHRYAFVHYTAGEGRNEGRALTDQLRYAAYQTFAP